jgi:hypothetical protein
MLTVIMGRESGFSIINSNNGSTLPLPRLRLAKEEEGCLVYSEASEEHLRISVEILDLLDDDEVAYLDEDTIRQGGQRRPIASTATATGTTTVIPSYEECTNERKKITEEDIEAFIQELEQGKKRITTAAELEEEEAEAEDAGVENPEAMDDEVIDEDGLEEVEVDVEEFYGGGEEEE